jgi:hypothetical protein
MTALVYIDQVNVLLESPQTKSRTDLAARIELHGEVTGVPSGLGLKRAIHPYSYAWA